MDITKLIDVKKALVIVRGIGVMFIQHNGGEIEYDGSLHTEIERDIIEGWLTGEGDLLQMDRNRYIVKSALNQSDQSYEEAQLAHLGIFIPPDCSLN